MSKAKMMYAFDHIPAGSSGTGGNVPTYSDFPFTWNAATSGGGPGAGGVTADSGGSWLSTTGPYGAAGNFYVGGWLFPVNQFDLTKPRGYYGFRFKATTSNRVNHPLVIMNAAKSAYGAVLVNIADFNWVTNQEYYIEVLIDRQNNQRTVWVDGALVINAQVFSQTILSTDYLSMGQVNGTGSSTSQSYYFKDIYVMDDPGDGSVSRLGPIIAKPITLAAATGNGWIGNAYTGTLSGTVAISTAQSKFGGASLAGGTTSSMCSFPDAPGLRTGATGDATYEAWVYNTSGSQTGAVFGKDNAVANSAHLTFANGNWQVLFDSSAVAINVAANMPLNAWVHMALVRYNGVWSLYQNGALLAQYTGGTFGNNSYPFVFANWGGANAPWQGYIDEGRVSNNARYTGPFTPPSAPFVPDANTMGLFHFNDSVGGFTADSSATAVQQLNTAVSATNSSIPNVLSPQDGTPLAMSVQTSADVGATVQGVLLVASGQRAAATGTTLRTTISDQAVPANQVQANPLQFPAGAFGYGKTLGFLPNALDGSSFTTAKVAQLSLSAVASAT